LPLPDQSTKNLTRTQRRDVARLARPLLVPLSEIAASGGGKGALLDLKLKSTRKKMKIVQFA